MKIGDYVWIASDQYLIDHSLEPRQIVGEDDFSVSWGKMWVVDNHGHLHKDQSQLAPFVRVATQAELVAYRLGKKFYAD